jgi:hypothetical protein
MSVLMFKLREFSQISSGQNGHLLEHPRFGDKPPLLQRMNPNDHRYTVTLQWVLGIEE